MTAPTLVSVVTPTWGRNTTLLERCIPSVVAQSYEHVEHVVVSDGPDPRLRQLLATVCPHIRFAELADHDPQSRWGHRARLHGIDLAAGDLICYLDDDNSYRPDHVGLLAEALRVSRCAGFAYSQMDVHEAHSIRQVGVDPPRYGQVDTSLIMHRRGLLDVAGWRDVLRPEPDWDLVDRWMAADVTWVHVDRVTVDYFRDCHHYS